MDCNVTFPSWEEFSEKLKVGLHYSDVTLERTESTYKRFVYSFCPTEGSDAKERILSGIENVSASYESAEISRDQLLRMRRLAYRLLMVLEDGKITWDRAPLYGKRYGLPEDEELLTGFMQEAVRKYAPSIVLRDKNLIRQFSLYCADYKGKNVLQMHQEDLIDFLRYMKKRRPGGLKSAASALKHFYIYLVSQSLAEESLMKVINPWGTPRRKVYRIFSIEEKQDILKAIDLDTEIGKRDYAIFSLLIDCGIRSSDICALKLTDIKWADSSLSFVQQKTGKAVSIPFSRQTGDALSDYILHARGKTPLPFIFVKNSYTDSKMTPSCLCVRLKTYLDKAGIKKTPDDRIGIHTFRRSLGTAMINSGNTLDMAGQVLGHSGTSATGRYLSFSETALKECALPMGNISGKQEVSNG